MSWSKSYLSREAFEKDEAASHSTATVLGDNKYVDDQISVARNVAAQIIESGAIGGGGKDFSVSMSGHANPDHEPAPNYTNDCISVSVSQKAAA